MASGSSPPSDSPPVPTATSPSTSPPPSSSPPPPASSPPPPPPESPPPPKPSPSAPPPQDSSSSPPPSSKTPPSPPPSDGGNGTNNSTPPPPPPPPPPSTHNSSKHLPPAPRQLSPSSRSSSDSNSSASKDGSSTDSMSVPLIVGVAVGAGVLLVVMILLYCLCTRKKKKQQNFYPPHPPRGGEYSDSRWQNSTQQSDHVVNIPPPPAGGYGAWQAQPPPPPSFSMNVSSDFSSNFSGSHGPALPPPHPCVALGFSKSGTYTYDQLAAATGGFSQANLLGQGGFGYVHKGVMNGIEIAVKSLKSDSGQGEREFRAEVEIISRVHHRHLVSLAGHCIEGGRKLLVYEYVPNNTLEYHLHGKDRPTMDWATRLKIAMGSAKGLAYLHEDCHPRIIHRDIKAANILLDHSYVAKVADFGLAKLKQDNFTHVSTRIMGTVGYLAPEYASSGKLTEKSDVFSFGVMLLELITGRHPVHRSGGHLEDCLVDWARPLCERAMDEGNYDELADPRLESNFVPQEMARMVACAAASIRHSARMRPKMSEIVRALEGNVSLDDLNKGLARSQSSNFGSSSAEVDAASYSADMKKFRKIASGGNDYASSEFGATSEYGLDPSSSSSSDSQEIMPRTTSQQPSSGRSQSKVLTSKIRNN